MNDAVEGLRIRLIGSDPDAAAGIRIRVIESDPDDFFDIEFDLKILLRLSFTLNNY